MRFPGVVEWDVGIVALSVIIGCIAATAALFIYFRMHANYADR